MEDSNLPMKFPIPWANGAGSGFIRPIPQASQIGIQNGAASLIDGFPPNCFVPIAGGGSWPWAQDMNGIFNQITQWLQWSQAGGPIAYDAAFQTAIGGYPSGAIVQSAVTVGLCWLSLVDNNTTNPDAGGAGWQVFARGRTNVSIYKTFSGVQMVSVNGGAYTATGAGSFPAPPFGTAEVELWAPGGGFGGSFGTGALSGAGGGGEYATGIFTGLITPTTITIAQPGTAGAGVSSPTSGGDAGASSFGTLLTALGGQGGSAQAGAGAAVPGTGGAGGTGGSDRNPGGQGSQGFPINGNFVYASLGGPSGFGTGFGVPLTGTVPVAGVPGQFPGQGATGSFHGADGAIGGISKMIVRW